MPNPVSATTATEGWQPGLRNHPRVGEDGPMTKIEPLGAVRERALAALWEETIAG